MTDFARFHRWLTAQTPDGPAGAPSAAQWIEIMRRSGDIRRRPRDGLFVTVEHGPSGLTVSAHTYVEDRR